MTVSHRIFVFLAGLVISALFSPRIPAANPTIPFQESFDITVSRIQLSPATRHGLFRASDSISIQTTSNVAFRVLSINGQVVYAGAATTRSFAPGHYFVETAGDRTQFAVLPDDYSGAPFLGTDALSGGVDPVNVLQNERVARIQPAWARIFTGWNQVQPQRGVYDWTALDLAVNANQGRQIIYRAFIRPTWVSDSEFTARFTEFVTEVARRYSGDLYAIEIWNEPDYAADTPYRLPAADWNGVASFYAQLLQASCQAIRSVTTSIRVVGPAWYGTGFDQETTQILQQAGSAALDDFSYHDYMMKFVNPDSTGQHYLDAIHQVSGLDNQVPKLATAALQKPMVVDEIGLYGQSALGIDWTPSMNELYDSTLDWYRGLCRAIKYAVLYRANGAEMLTPHGLISHATYPNPNLQIHGWDLGVSTTSNRGPHPKSSAFLMSCYWLNGASFVQKRTLGGKVLLYSWQRPNNTAVVFAWVLEGQTASFKTNTTLAATDVYGSSLQVSGLSQEPLLFHAANTNVTALMGSIVTALDPSLNLPPVWQPIANQSIVAGQPLQFSVAAADPDGDALSYAASGLPSGASFNASTRIFTWAPTTAQVGSYPVSFTVTDARGLSSMATTILTVLANPLDGRTAYWKFDETNGTTATDSAGTNHGVLRNFNFSGSSGWTAGHVDNTLSFDGINDYVSLSSGPLNLTNNFTILAWVYPRSATASTAFLSVRCTYQSSGLRAFISGNALLVQGQAGASWRSAIVASGAFQNNNWHHLALVYDKSTVKAYVNGVLQGTANWGSDLVMNAASPSWLGTEGSYFFNGMLDEVMVFNRTLGADEILALMQSNQPPMLTAIGSKSVNEEGALSFPVSAADGDGDTLTYSAADLPSGASFNTSTRAFSWSPTYTQAGTYNVTFTVSDGTATDSETVAITVANVNLAPVLAAIGNKSVAENAALSFTVSATDPDGNSLAYSASGLPSGASFNTSTRTFSWTPNASQAGSYTVNFSGTDGSLTDSEAVTITVANVNRAPVLNSIGAKSVVAGQNLSFTISGSDPDGDALAYSVSSLPAGATFNTSTRTFGWIPSATQTGTVSVGFTVTDSALTDSETVPIIVSAASANTAPAFAGIDILTGVANAPLTYNLMATDADGDSLTFSASGLPAGATLNAATGGLTWTPTVSQVGAFNATATVTDGLQSVLAEMPLLVVHPNFDWLAGAKLFAYQVLNANRIFVYAFRRPDRTSMVVAWCKTGNSVVLSATPGLTRTSLSNQAYTSTALGSQPVLFHTAKRVSPRQALDQVVAAIHY